MRAGGEGCGHRGWARRAGGTAVALGRKPGCELGAGHRSWQGQLGPAGLAPECWLRSPKQAHLERPREQGHRASGWPCLRGRLPAGKGVRQALPHHVWPRSCKGRALCLFLSASRLPQAWAAGAAIKNPSPSPPQDPALGWGWCGVGVGWRGGRTCVHLAFAPFLLLQSPAGLPEIPPENTAPVPLAHIG